MLFRSSTRMDAPIFYDYNNTSYYVDPTSGLSVNINGGIQSNAYNNTGYLSFNNSGTYWGIIGNYASNDWRIGYGSYSALTGWNLRWDSSGNAWSNASHRSPIFYDSDNTAYYVDPNSTSDQALRMRGGALFGPNSTWGAYLMVGSNGNGTSGSYASVATTNGNLHLDAASGYGMYLNYYYG